MSTWELRRLPWLPAPPDDLRARTRTASDGPALSALARHALDDNQLVRLAKALGRVRASTTTEPLRPVKLAIVGNATTTLWSPSIEATGLRHGLDISVVQTGHDQSAQELLDPDSSLHRAEPDLVLFALDHRAWPLAVAPGEAAAMEAAVGRSIDTLRMLRAALASGCGARAILQTVPPPDGRLFGSLDRRLPGTARASVAALNEAIGAEASERGDLLLDAAALASEVGLSTWHDPAQWNLYKLPFAQRLVPLWADHLARLIAASVGKVRKVLVLDLDNTCWGGVIGDDGLEGIVLGQGSAVGEAHLAVQQAALDLRGRGIVLAVCSKNTDAVARRPFREHPEMLLREEHIAVFQANWVDKATNLEAIAETLGLGLDSLVFVDDNPAERAQVRRALPEVAVPELPEDPADYVRAVLDGGWFEAVSFTAADVGRAEQYRANAARAELQGSSRDLGTYLASLDMQAAFAPFDAVGRARISQLIGRSNQYNLTTRRRGEDQVAELQEDPSAWTLQVRLRDDFGDNGMISVVVCLRGEATWEIDTWLMSCRVLGRRLQERVLDEIVRAAREAGASELLGRWIPSGRNDLVADHYPKLGFAAAPEAGGEGRCWALALVDHEDSDAPIAVTGQGG